MITNKLWGDLTDVSARQNATLHVWHGLLKAAANVNSAATNVDSVSGILKLQQSGFFHCHVELRTWHGCHFTEAWSLQQMNVHPQARFCSYDWECSSMSSMPWHSFVYYMITSIIFFFKENYRSIDNTWTWPRTVTSLQHQICEKQWTPDMSPSRNKDWIWQALNTDTV